MLQQAQPNAEYHYIIWKENGNFGQQKITKATKMDLKLEKDLNLNQPKWVAKTKRRDSEWSNYKLRQALMILQSLPVRIPESKTPRLNLALAGELALATCTMHPHLLPSPCRDSKVPTRLSMAKCFSFTLLIRDGWPCRWRPGTLTLRVIIMISLWWYDYVASLSSFQTKTWTDFRHTPPNHWFSQLDDRAHLSIQKREIYSN